MSSVSVPGPVVASRDRSREIPATVHRRGHLFIWFGGGAVLAFAVSFIGTDLLELHHDLYLLIYFTVMGLFVASFFAHNRNDLTRMFRVRLAWSLGVGVLVAIVLTLTVLRDPSTAHPSGIFYAFEMGWRGVVYGVVDAAVLFMFPAAVAYLLMKGDRTGIKRKFAFAGLTLVLSLAITATYHLGYEQFRGSDLVKPEIGAVLANVPAVFTGNPAGAVIAHDVFHIGANVHAYRSGIFLPPDLNGYAERGAGGAGVAVAIAWVILAGGCIWVERRRLFPRAQE